MVNVTYNAPEGDDQVVTYMGVKFFDGHPVTIDTEANPYLVGKAKANQHFSVDEDGEEIKPRGPGRPRKQD